MRKIFLLACLSATTLFSCKKEEPIPKQPCEINNTGNLKVVNSTIDDFALYVDGEYIAICKSATIKTVAQKVGSHVIQVVNLSNTSDYRTASITIVQCTDYEISIN